MSHHPYPNPDRARRQLDRHDDETGPLLPARQMSPLEHQLQEATSTAMQALRPQLEAVGASLLAAFQPRPAHTEEPAPEPAELRWHYGPTDWAPDPGRMWHYDCPGGRGEVMYDGDGWAFCMGCKAVQAPEGDEPERPVSGEDASG